MINIEQKNLDKITEVLSSLLNGKPVSSYALPQYNCNDEFGQMLSYLAKFIDTYAELQDFSSSLSTGELSSELPNNNLIISQSLKHLQSNLRHLTWKTKQISAGDFEQKVDFMGEFSDAFNSMTEKLKVAFNEVERQNRFQRLVADISTDFVNTTAENIGEKIVRMLKLSGEFFGVDRSYLYERVAGKNLYKNTYEWCADGIESILNKKHTIPINTYSWFCKQLADNDYLYIPDCNNLPPEALAEKNELIAQSVFTLICLPIKRSDTLIGFIGFDFVKDKGDLADEQILFFRVAANIVADALKSVQTQLALRQSEQKSREATIAKSSFLANMSHEIRTPMNGVIGMIELLIESGLNKTQTEYAEIIRSSGNSMLTLINDILDFSKIEAGKLTLEPRYFVLHEIIEQTTRILSVMADKKGLNLKCDIKPDVYKYLNGDPDRLRQILINIMGNAVKFTDKGWVRLTVSTAAVNNSQITLLFEVEDTGIGIPPEKKELLFNAFEQLDNTGTKKIGGTGLGLAIAKSLVKLMGGDIELQSELGKGATFRFTAVFIKQPQRAWQADVVAGKEKTKALPANCRILIAEDNPISQKVAKSILEHLGISSDVVGDGQSAINALAKRDYDLVLMDMQMPIMGGVEATKKLRAAAANEKNQKLPIIAMTANAMESDKQVCLQAGMNDYISKPITASKIMPILSKWLNDRSL